MIVAENLVKIYGNRRVVDDVSLHVEKGEVLGFLGPNGAGKSTSMRMITGFLPMDEGSVSIGGFDIIKDPIKAKTLVGYLPEHAPSYGEMKVEHFLNFIADLRKIRGKAKREAVNKAIETCFLEPVRRQSIQTLSKGYRHRTCFAQALLHDPEVLILDEPTDGLDPNQKQQMRDLICEMGKTKAIIISTHILEEVDAVCSRISLIDKGKHVFHGTPDEMRAKSKNFGSIILSLVNSPEEIFEKLKALNSTETVESISENTFMLKPKNLELCRHDIFKLCETENLDIKSLEVNRGDLTEVFRALTIGSSEEKYDF